MSCDVSEIIQKLVGWTLEALSVDAAKEVSSPVSVPSDSSRSNTCCMARSVGGLLYMAVWTEIALLKVDKLKLTMCDCSMQF